MNVLFLSAWYPNRYDAMAGLFVRKHAAAVARQANVCVLYAMPDAKVQHTERICQNTTNIHETYYYYPKSKFNIINLLRHFRCLWKGIKYIRSTVGKPDITQCNVLTKDVLLARWLQLFYHIPYVVIEHWSGYLPTNGDYDRSSTLKHLLIRRLAHKATCILTVSDHLKTAMQSHNIYANYQKINNVVDDFFYRQQPQKMRDKKRILHVSCFDEKAKNICGILRAIQKLSTQRTDFEVIIIGTGADFKHVTAYAQSLGLAKTLVRFIGEQTPQQVCNWMQQSDFLLLFSNYENAPVVISEALAVGLPVLSSRVGGIAEMLSEQSGRLTPPGDEDVLLTQTAFMLDHCHDFDADKIRQDGLQYSSETVGTKLLAIYRAAISSTLLQQYDD